MELRGARKYFKQNTWIKWVRLFTSTFSMMFVVGLYLGIQFWQNLYNIREEEIKEEEQAAIDLGTITGTVSQDTRANPI